MAHLHKKMKKGRAYYYIRESKRINGKPTIVNQVYLGSADKILAMLWDRDQRLPERFASKEFGSLFILNELDRTINLAGIVDDVVPSKRKTSGMSLGDLLYAVVANRAIAPRSKRQLADWYATTDMLNIRPVRLESLRPQYFWNHFDRVTREDLQAITERFFAAVGQLAPQSDHLFFDTTNDFTYLDARTPSELAKRGYNKAGKHQLRQVGLALMTERASGLPVYYQPYPGNLHDARFFDEHLADITHAMTRLGRDLKGLTLIFDRGMNSEATIERLDANPDVHFVTSYSPYFASELARIPLKQFQALNPQPDETGTAREAKTDVLLYYQTTAVFWGRRRQVVITYNPKTFRKKRYELRDKLDKVRHTLYDLRRKHREGRPHWRKPEAIRAHYDQLCETLHLNPAFFDLSFYRDDDGPHMAFRLNRYQTELYLKRLAKTILISDHEAWSAQDIYRAYLERYEVEQQFRQAKSPFQVALMPQYHWTDSQIRLHVFVCVAALTYLTLLRNRLRNAGLDLSAQGAIESLRALRTALYWMPEERKPRRLLEEPTETQTAILKAFDYVIKGGRVLHTQ